MHLGSWLGATVAIKVLKGSTAVAVGDFRYLPNTCTSLTASTFHLVCVNKLGILCPAGRSFWQAPTGILAAGL